MNVRQAAAVACDRPCVVVRAGAGSGKTRVLTERALRAVREDVRDVTMCTFTNAAAREMALRMGSNGGHVVSGTIHSLAARMLRRLPARLPEGVGIDFRVADGRTVRMAAEGSDGRDVQGEIHRSNMLTYDDIFDLALAAVRAGDVPEPGLLLFDEAQDATGPEWEFVRLLAGRRFVVADSAQSIYGWRGGRPEEFVREGVAARADGAAFRLPVNYRSTPEILAVANAVPTPWRIGLEAHRASGVPVRRLDGVPIRDVVAGIVRERACRPEDVALIGRTKAVLRWAAADLDAAGMPWRSPSLADDEWESASALVAICAAHVAADPHDSLHLRPLLVEAGWSDLDLARADLGRARARTSLWGWAMSEGGDRGAALAGLRGVSHDHADDAVRSVLSDVMGWAAAGHRRAVDLIGAWRVGMAPAEGTAPADFLRWLSDPQREDVDVNGHGGGPLLTTVHGAKGREWPHVVVLGLEDGVFPLTRAIHEDALEEERRLFYVAVTRAMDSLSLHVGAEERDWRGRPSRSGRPVHVSRFLEEVGR